MVDSEGREFREASLARSIDEFRRQLEADPLLPTADMRRRLDAIADEVLDLLPPEADA